MLGVGTSLSLVLYTLKQNINLYYTPTQLKTTNVLSEQIIRLGGIVEKSSVKFSQNGLQVKFFVADSANRVQVNYSGVLPALFREGQGVVVEGELKDNIFIAEQVLAKHDEKYIPGR